MRKYLLNFFLVVLLVLLPALFFSWWAQPIYGDLTRIGYWSEHDFGPRAISPTIHVRASGRALSNADVWVLGDSFTVLNLWQSVLSDNTGHVVKSFQYGNNCLDNWIASAIAEPTSKIIIVEAVEREFINQFSKTSSCPHSDMVPSEVQAELKESFRPTWPPTLSLSYVITTAMNTAELNISHKNLGSSSNVL